MQQNQRMKKMSYYVVEVSFKSTNPIHRAICFHRSRGFVELTASYEGMISTSIEKLAFFNVVEEIESMTEPYPNQYKMP